MLDSARCTASSICFASAAERARGFSQMMCFPASAAAMQGSAWTLLGPPLSNTCTASSLSISRQSV